MGRKSQNRSFMSYRRRIFGFLFIVAVVFIIWFYVIYVVMIKVVHMQFLNDSKHSGTRRKRPSGREETSWDTYITVINLMEKKVSIRVPLQYATTAEKISNRNRPGTYTKARLPPISGSGLLIPGSEEEIFTKKLHALRFRKIISPHDYSYRIDPVVVCSQRRVDVIVAVTLPPGLETARHSFRKHIWGGYGSIYNRAEGVELLFFVGVQGDKQHNMALAKESRRYGDIVQASYIDTVDSGSATVVSALSWVTSHCPTAKFVITATENCVVNIPLMLTELKLQRSAQSPLFILGRVASPPPPPPRDSWALPRAKGSRKQSRRLKVSGGKDGIHRNGSGGGGNYSGGHGGDRIIWLEQMAGVTKIDKQSIQFLERGCMGLPMSVARLLYEAALRMPVLKHENVLITGMCAGLLNIPLYNNQAFYLGLTHNTPQNSTSQRQDKKSEI